MGLGAYESVPPPPKENFVTTPLTPSSNVTRHIHDIASRSQHNLKALPHQFTYERLCGVAGDITHRVPVEFIRVIWLVLYVNIWPLAKHTNL